jgi:hypothetical protein
LPSRLRGESSLLTIISLTGLRAFHQQATPSIQGGGVSFRPGTWHFPKDHVFSPHALLPQEADTHYRNVASRRLKIRRIVPPYLGWVCWNEQSPNGEFSPSGRRAKFRHEPNFQSAVGFKSVMVGELLPVAVQSWNSRRPHSAYLCRPLGISANAVARIPQFGGKDDFGGDAPQLVQSRPPFAVTRAWLVCPPTFCATQMLPAACRGWRS